MSNVEDLKEHDSHIEEQRGHVQVEDAVAGAYVDPTLIITEEENRRLKRKVFRNLLPFMCVAYITQSLDKGTLSQSSIMGWQASVGAKGQDYALTSTFLWVGIIVGEPIVNQFIRKLPVAKVLGISMFIWSALVFGLAFSLHVAPVFAIRFLLGLFESSFSPCLITITVQWFTAPEQTLIVTLWQSMFAIASFLSNLIAYGFYSINGADNIKTKGLYAWQWMTVVIALISCVCSVVVIIGLPDTPIQARWASEEDKPKFVERVRVNDQGIKQKKWKQDQVNEIFRDPLPWLLFMMIFILSSVVGGLNTFNSILINKAFGFSTSEALLLGLPLATFQVILYFFIGWLGTKTGQTVLCMIGYTAVNIAGTVVLITVAPTSTSKVGLLIAFYFMQCFQSLNPSVHAMLSRNISGQTKKSIVYAMFFVGWAGGNAIGPQIFQSIWASRYLNSLYIHLALYGAFLIDIILIRVLLKARNDSRDRAVAGGENKHANAFDDMTDLQNQDFRYSY